MPIESFCEGLRYFTQNVYKIECYEYLIAYTKLIHESAKEFYHISPYLSDYHLL